MNGACGESEGQVGDRMEGGGDDERNTEETGAMPAKIRSPTTNLWAEYRNSRLMECWETQNFQNI